MDGNRDLFWGLVQPEHLKARAFCRKLIGSREDGDDLYQDCLVTALTRFGDLREQAAFKPWLYRIIVNQYKNHVRTPWWKRKISLTDEMAETVGGEDPTDRYRARLRLEKVFKALSAEERALITLYELQGWTVAELARLLGKNEGNIKVRLSRTRQKMRKELLKHNPSTTRHEKAKKNKPLECKDRICVATKPGEN